MKQCPVQECSLTADDLDVEAVIKLGRPRKWSDPDEFVDAINNWIRKRKCRMAWKYIHGVGLVKLPDPQGLSIASLCCYLRISPRTFYRWRKNEEHPLFDICDMTMVAIEADLWDQETRAAMLNLQCNFGHRLKVDIPTDGASLPTPVALRFDPSRLTTEDLKFLQEMYQKSAV